MSKQYTKVNVEEMTVEDGGILYDMEDLGRLHDIYGRLCTAEFIMEYDEDVTADEAYQIAGMIREKLDDICDCESVVLDCYYQEFKRSVKEDEA